jgi:hypothetical protein
LYQSLLSDADSTIFCLPSIGILRMRRVTRGARCAAAYCIPSTIGASRAAVLTLSARRITSASASAAQWTAVAAGQRHRLLRFLKVYLATIVVVSTIQHGVTERQMRQLTASTGGR